MRKLYKHLTLEQRLMIEEKIYTGVGVQEIAQELGVSNASIYRELKRGAVNGKYSAEDSQARYEKNLSSKGIQPLILQNQKLRDYIARQITVEKKSPKEIEEQLLREDDLELGSVCHQTIYDAVYKGYIPGVTIEDYRNNCATVQKDGSIYLPKWFAERYEIVQGMQFELSVEDDKIILHPINHAQES